MNVIFNYNFVFKSEIINIILMGKEIIRSGSLNEFLEKIANIYNSPYGFSKLEDFAKEYQGEYKKELSIIMGYIYSVNTGGSSRIFRINVLDLDQILDKTLSK